MDHGGGGGRSSSRLRDRLARMFRPGSLLRSTCNNNTASTSSSSCSAAASATADGVTASKPAPSSACSSSRALLAADSAVARDRDSFLTSSRRDYAVLVGRTESFSNALDRVHRRTGSGAAVPARFSVHASPLMESKKKEKEKSPLNGHPQHRHCLGGRAKGDKSKKLLSNNPYGFSSSDDDDDDADTDVFRTAEPMSRLHTTAPISLLRRSSSTSTSPHLRQPPHVALVAATERVRSGTLSPDDAHHLFDELLRQATPVPERSLNGFLATLARAPASAACGDGLSLDVALFGRMSSPGDVDGLPVAPPTVHTYGIVLDCSCRARQPDLALALFGRFLRAGLKANDVIVNTLLKVLCHAKRTDEALDALLHRMPDLGCVPDVISYNTVIHGLCDDSRSQRALDLLRTMAAKQQGTDCCSPDVVSYTTVIHGLLKEGNWSLVCSLFHEMVNQGLVPTAITYSLIIDGLYKHGRTKKGRQILDYAVAKGLKPNIAAYSTMLNGYAKEGCLADMKNLYGVMVGQGIVPNQYVVSIMIKAYAECGSLDEAVRIFEGMQKQGVKPNVVTCSTMIHALCREGRMDDAIKKFNEMISMGVPPDVGVYGCLIQGYCTHGDLSRAKDLVYEMMGKGIRFPDTRFFRSVITSLHKEGRETDAKDIFDFMVHMGEKRDVITSIYCKGNVPQDDQKSNEIVHWYTQYNPWRALQALQDLLPARYQFFKGAV